MNHDAKRGSKPHRLKRLAKGTPKLDAEMRDATEIRKKIGEATHRNRRVNQLVSHPITPTPKARGRKR